MAYQQYAYLSQTSESSAQNVWSPARDSISQEPNNDDIIQKSLAISGISREVVEASRTPRHESPVLAEASEETDDGLSKRGQDIQDMTSDGQFREDESLAVKASENQLDKDANVVVNVNPEEGDKGSVGGSDPLDLSCEICLGTFDNLRDFQSHIRTHTTSFQYECASCNALFRLGSELQKHVVKCKMSAQNRPYRCDQCDQSFYKKTALHRHVMQHKENRPRYPCEVCGKSFASEAYREKHREKHDVQVSEEDELKEEKVDDANKENDAEDEAEEEQKDVFRSLRKRRKKTIIDYDYDGDDDIYLEEMADAVGESAPRKSRGRGKITTPERRISLPKKPKTLVSEKKKFKCGKCLHLFDSAEERAAHVQTHIPLLGDKEHMCSICGKSYTMSCNLERHSLVHSNTRMHRCDICGKGFHRVDILDRHRRIHTGEKPHKCPMAGCDESFISSAALLNHHKRVHAERQFSCEHCSDSFLTEEKLKKHMKMHGKDRRYACDKCGKAFINTSNLKTHMRIHTKEKPFICDHCGERFTQKSHVERHILIHTRPKEQTVNPPLNQEAIQQVVKQLYFCRTCNKSFPKRRGLRMHERMRHGLPKAAKPKPPEPRPPNTSQNLDDLQNPSGWYPSLMQAPPPRPQPQHVPPPQPHSMHQQQLQYTLPLNQVQHCTVYNANGNVYTQQYIPQQAMNQFDIHIQPGMSGDEQVVFTAADSHDTIMYLIEAAGNNIINQSVPQQSVQAQIIHPQQLQHSENDHQYAEIHIQQPQTHQVIQPQQIQIEHISEPSTVSAVPDIPRPPKTQRRYSRVEKNAVGAKPYKCTLCGDHFTSSGVLVKHTRIHTGEKPYSCVVCGQSFAQIGNLHRHVKSHQGVRNHRCNVCGKTFTRRERLLYHSKLHTGEKNFKCGDCGREFAHKVNLMSHYNRKHSTYKPFSCPTCGKTFADKRSCKMHAALHESNPEDRVACEDCGKTFRDAKVLAKHSRVHHNIRPHKCEHCSKSYTLPSSLRNHIAAHHSPAVPESQKYKCDHCPKKFSLKSALQSHLKIHLAPKFSCDICNKKFTVSSNLINHKRIHSGEKPFKCTKCLMSFTQRGHLARHHSVCSKKQYGCFECQSSFRNLQSLSAHISRQHGVQPKKKFPCEFCNLHFSSSYSLDKHLKAEHPNESNEKNQLNNTDMKDESEDWSCTICSKSFSSERDLAFHESKCGPNLDAQKSKESAKKIANSIRPKPFKCATCSQCFAVISQLRNHMKSHVVEVFKCKKCGEKIDQAAKVAKHLEICGNVGNEPSDQSDERTELVEPAVATDTTVPAGQVPAGQVPVSA